MPQGVGLMCEFVLSLLTLGYSYSIPEPSLSLSCALLRLLSSLSLRFRPCSPVIFSNLSFSPMILGSKEVHRFRSWVKWDLVYSFSDIGFSPTFVLDLVVIGGFFGGSCVAKLCSKSLELILVWGGYIGLYSVKLRFRVSEFSSMVSYFVTCGRSV